MNTVRQQNIAEVGWHPELFSSNVLLFTCTHKTLDISAQPEPRRKNVKNLIHRSPYMNSHSLSVPPHYQNCTIDVANKAVAFEYTLRNSHHVEWSCLSQGSTAHVAVCYHHHYHYHVRLINNDIPHCTQYKEQLEIIFRTQHANTAQTNAAHTMNKEETINTVCQRNVDEVGNLWLNDLDKLQKKARKTVYR